MTESLHDFLRWGPYGLYATFALMILAIPLGWMYAYIACVGKRRDITEPDPERRAAAWGGAVIIAVAIFVGRQIIWGDSREFDDAMHWAQHDSIKFFGWLCSPFVNAVGEYLQPTHPLYVRLLAYLAALIILPGTVAVALFGMMAAIIFVGLGTVAAVVAGFSFGAYALAAALWFLPGFLIGVPIVLYFLFVRLPLQVAYRRAIREGRWPTTAELVLALRKGTLDKAAWQSKIMAYKSRKFEAGLNRDMERISRRIR